MEIKYIIFCGFIAFAVAAPVTRTKRDSSELIKRLGDRSIIKKLDKRQLDGYNSGQYFGINSDFVIRQQEPVSQGSYLQQQQQQYNDNAQLLNSQNHEQLQQQHTNGNSRSLLEQQSNYFQKDRNTPTVGYSSNDQQNERHENSQSPMQSPSPTVSAFLQNNRVNPPPYYSLNTGSNVTPGPRNLVWNQAPAVDIQNPKYRQELEKKTPSSRQLFGTSDFIFPGPLSSMYDTTLIPNFIPGNNFHLFTPGTTAAQTVPFDPSLLFRTSNPPHYEAAVPPIRTPDIYYTNTPSNYYHQGQSGHPQNFNNRQQEFHAHRQIIPTPQEFFNSALNVGTNIFNRTDIFERIPGFTLTTNVVGFLGNVTRLGATLLTNQIQSQVNPYHPSRPYRPSTGNYRPRPGYTTKRPAAVDSATPSYYTEPMTTTDRNAATVSINYNSAEVPASAQLPAQSGVHISSELPAPIESPVSAEYVSHPASDEVIQISDEQQSPLAANLPPERVSDETGVNRHEQESVYNRVETDRDRKKDKIESQSNENSSSNNNSSYSDSVAADEIPDEMYDNDSLREDDDKIDSKAIISIVG